MTADIVFVDTECSGLLLSDEIWEFAAIRRRPDGHESQIQFFIEHDLEKAKNLPEVFRQDHDARYDPKNAVDKRTAAVLIQTMMTSQPHEPNPHVVGAVPNFDTERIALLIESQGFRPGWHYHLIDVETLAVGYLAATMGPGWRRYLPLPWNSHDLSRLVGVEPGEVVHQAMADAQWARALFDKIMTEEPRV